MEKQKERKNTPGRRESVFEGKVENKHAVWGSRGASATEGRLEPWERRQEVDFRPGCRRPWVPSEGVWVSTVGNRKPFGCLEQGVV